MGIPQKSLGDGFYSFSKGHWGLQLHGEALMQSYVCGAELPLGSGDPSVHAEERTRAPSLNYQKIKHMSPFTQARN